MSGNGRRPLAVHEPAGYPCPFCAVLRGDPMTAPRLEDVVAERERAVAFISPRWWARNTGHVLVVPRTHVENLYEVSSPDLHGVMDLVQEVARAMRASYGCSGVSTRQHNEPAGGQDVWHLHVHVFPRYPDDRLYETEPLAGFIPAEERAPFARRLAAALCGSGGAAHQPRAGDEVLLGPDRTSVAGPRYVEHHHPVPELVEGCCGSSWSVPFGRLRDRGGRAVGTPTAEA